MTRPDLFVDGEFTSHSGLRLPFKIDCDVLTDGDIDTLASAISRRLVRFSAVYGIPRGGVRLADALARLGGTGSQLDPLLIVDDVLTTGASMREARDRFGPNTIGIVIFARGPCPDWVVPIFTVSHLGDAL